MIYCMKKLLRILFAAVALAFVPVLLAAGRPKAQKVRILYWNIQNGMWSDQANNYNNFVKFVKRKKPDICVWAEAKSLYYSGTADRLDASEQYLPKHWPELAARYGHKYTCTVMQRDNYPQVITSRWPIEEMLHIEGSRPDSVVAHGAGWVRFDVNGKKLNVVTVHTYPQKYRYGIPVSDRERSAAAREGDAYRRTEVQYICEHTVLEDPAAEDNLWFMCGDFNSISRVDNHHYKLPEDAPDFQCQDYIARNTPYIDVIAELNPEMFLSSNRGTRRGDYIYCTKALMDCLKDAHIVNEKWTIPVKAAGSTGFFNPSDHRPIIADFKL